MDNDEYIYVADYTKHEVRRWKIGDTNGTLIADRNGAGNRLDQLNCPYFILVDQDQSVYVSDGNNHRRVIVDQLGTVVIRENGHGLQSNQFHGPVGLSFDRQNNLYVADYSNRRIQKFDIEGN